MQSQLKQTGKWLQSPRKYVLLNINFFITVETYIIWTYIFPWERYAYARTCMNLEILENPMWWTAISGKPRLNREIKVPWIELEKSWILKFKLVRKVTKFHFWYQRYSKHSFQAKLLWVTVHTNKICSS